MFATLHRICHLLCFPSLCLIIHALPGQGPVVELLLRSGANQEKRAKNGKTSANMAAFVGSKECLAVLNNYLPLQDVMYHTEPRSLDKTDFLPPNLAPILHHVCCMNNLNPVKILLYIKEHTIIVEPAHRLQVSADIGRVSVLCV